MKAEKNMTTVIFRATLKIIAENIYRNNLLRKRVDYLKKVFTKMIDEKPINAVFLDRDMC
jgi:hypothetical protein